MRNRLAEDHQSAVAMNPFSRAHRTPTTEEIPVVAADHPVVNCDSDSYVALGMADMWVMRLKWGLIGAVSGLVLILLDVIHL